MANAHEEARKQEKESKAQEKIEAQRIEEEQATALALEKEKEDAENAEKRKEEEARLREAEEAEAKINKEIQEKEEAKRQEDLEIERKKTELAQEQIKEVRQSREAAERRRNEEREIERLRQAENDSLIAEMKKIGDAMKHVLPRMPNDIMEVPLYFETVENAFRSFEVDRRYWVKLLLPLMTQRAGTVINRVTLAERDNYVTVKEQLLKDFKLTPREYRSKFMDAKKTAEETYTMFTARLKNLLNYYVKSRQVNDDYENLFDLFISDKLKESLPPGPLQFVLSKEGTECFKASMIADLADIHANNKIGMPSYSKQSYRSTLSDKTNSSGNGFQFPDKRYQGASSYNRQSQSERNSPERRSYENQDQKQVGWRTPKNQRVTESSTPRGFGGGYSKTNDDVKRCHHCGSDQHLVRECEKAKGNQGMQEKRADFRSMKINLVHLQRSKENLDLQEINQPLKDRKSVV